MKIFNQIKRFLKNIQIILVWIPTLWNDRDYDYMYLLIIMKFKLIRMIKFFKNEKYLVSENCDQSIEEMKEVVNLLDRIINDKSWTDGLKEFKEVFPDYDWEFNFELDEKTGFQKMINKNSQELKQEYIKFIEKSALKLDQEYLKLFELLSLNIRKWWE